MSQDLAEREAGLVGVERPVEHDRHEPGRAAGPFAAGLDDLDAALLVMGREFVDALVQSHERQIVARQHERVGRHRRLQAAQRAQEDAERIALGIARGGR